METFTFILSWVQRCSTVGTVRSYYDATVGTIRLSIRNKYEGL